MKCNPRNILPWYIVVRQSNDGASPPKETFNEDLYSSYSTPDCYWIKYFKLYTSPVMLFMMKGF